MSGEMGDRERRLREEVRHPYRPLRRFVYVALGGSGVLGALVFSAQLLAGKGNVSLLGNLALQLGVIAATVWLLRRDRG